MSAAVLQTTALFPKRFPYEHDQWISAAATARAVMALAPAAALEIRAAK